MEGAGGIQGPQPPTLWGPHHSTPFSLAGPHGHSPRGGHTWYLVLRGWGLKGDTLLASDAGIWGMGRGGGGSLLFWRHGLRLQCRTLWLKRTHGPAGVSEVLGASPLGPGQLQVCARRWPKTPTTGCSRHCTTWPGGALEGATGAVCSLGGSGRRQRQGGSMLRQGWGLQRLGDHRNHVEEMGSCEGVLHGCLPSPLGGGGHGPPFSFLTLRPSRIRQCTSPALGGSRCRGTRGGARTGVMGCAGSYC